ncbi:MAG: CHASE domain-containing protein [Planctomycetota bacterium]
MLRSTGTLALRIVVVAVAYYVVGRLSNLLAIPPDYASAVWPAAGAALAAAILWGHAVLAGVLIGAFAVNLTQSHGDPIVASSVGVGAVLQAATGAWIARRIAGPGNPLDGPGSVLSTLFVAAPLSCLVSPTWGVATIMIVQPGFLENPAFEWATWWAGDTIGVLIFLPVLLAWTAKPAEVWRVRRWTLTLPLVACFVLVVALFFYSRSAEDRRAEAALEIRRRPIAAAIVREIERASSAVIALASLFRASDRVDPDEFEIFAKQMLEERPSVRALQWSLAVPREKRAEVEQKAREEGVEGFYIKEWATPTRLQPAGDRDRLFPVYYVEPREPNFATLGFDLASEATRWDGMRAAIETTWPTVSERLRRTHEVDDAWTVMLFVPVYLEPHPPPLADRSRLILGLVVGVLNLDELVRSATKGLDCSGLIIQIRDPSASPGNSRLYGKEEFDVAEVVDEHHWKHGNRKWEILIGPAGRLPRIWSAWYVLAGGLLFTGLFGAFMLELVTRHIHIERLVARRTSELARANDELQRSNLELQRFAHVASHDLREPLRTMGSYAQLLGESAVELEPDHRKFLERILGATRRMQALVDALLALSRVEGGATKMERVPLEKLVGFALENLQPAIEAAGARIEVGELPTVTCDPSQIVQLFQNLIANAVKFRREDVVPYVRIHCRRDGDFFEISVKDNGIGIAPEHHARVFEMFERLHTRERYGGTGMGLAICRKIVDRHGGRIWLESLPEGGSIFRFTLRAESEPG